MRKFLILFLSITAIAGAYAESTQIMIGASDMRETSVWVKSDNILSLSATCSPASKPEEKIKGKIIYSNDHVFQNIAKVVFINLEPNTEYICDIDSTKGKFKTSPDYETKTPPPDFTFVAAGANHFNDTKFDPAFRIPGGDYGIFESIRKTNPAFVIWAGGTNNLRTADIGSKSAIYSRYLIGRTQKEISPLLENQPNYGVTAVSAYGRETDDSSMSNRDDSLAIFDMFWANPTGADKSSRSYSFRYSDCEFFILDDCSNRSNLDYKNSRPKMLGASQINWLITALQNSTAKFKFIVMNSSMLNPVKSRTNFTFAEAERKLILDFLADKKIEGVMAISANKPYAEITRFVRAGSYPMYEITTGPLTARLAKEIEEMNYFRMPSSSTLKRSFAQIKVEGAENARIVTVTLFDVDGKPGFTTSIKEESLRKFD